MATGRATDNEGIIIESNDSNTIRPANLAKRAVHFPDTAPPKNSTKRHGKRSSTKRNTTVKTEEPAFVVKVKRRWNTAKEKVLRGLGLYGQIEEMPLGLVIDIWI